jgi:protein involved in temperature-dependent protein secretion
MTRIHSLHLDPDHNTTDLVWRKLAELDNERGEALDRGKDAPDRMSQSK